MRLAILGTLLALLLMMDGHIASSMMGKTSGSMSTISETLLSMIPRLIERVITQMPAFDSLPKLTLLTRLAHTPTLPWVLAPSS